MVKYFENFTTSTVSVKYKYLVKLFSLNYIIKNNKTEIFPYFPNY